MAHICYFMYWEPATFQRDQNSYVQTNVNISRWTKYGTLDKVHIKCMLNFGFLLHISVGTYLCIRATIFWIVRLNSYPQDEFFLHHEGSFGRGQSKTFCMTSNVSVYTINITKGGHKEAKLIYTIINSPLESVVKLTRTIIVAS